MTNLSAWLGIGLFNATQNVFVMRSEGMHHAWTALFFTLLFSLLPWAAVTPFVLALGRSFPPSSLRKGRTWLMHALACVAIGAFAAFWISLLETLTNPWALGTVTPFGHLWIDRFYNGILDSVFLYAAILAVGLVLDSRDRLARQQTDAARLTAQLSEARFEALRRQIEPHFFFNALNAVTGLIRDGRNGAAIAMIAGLGDCFRRILDDGSDRQQVTLGEELEFLQKYLDIQKARFDDRLSVLLELPTDLARAQVPRFLLQPLVENAIEHGVVNRALGGTIRIVASRSHDRLTLSIYNDGPPLAPKGSETRTGIGVANIVARLRTLYGDAFEFSLENRQPGGVEALVSLPLTVE